VEVNAERTPVPECNACQTISSVPERLPTPWFKRGLPQQPQASDSTDAKFSNSLVRPVYLLTSLGLLGLREADSAQQVNIARIGANVVPKWVY
jgi:hypothetical protein